MLMSLFLSPQENCPHLEVLAVACSCLFLSPQENCPNLEVLDVGRCLFMSLFLSPQENCPNLEVLDVGRCRGDLLNMDVELWQHSLPKLRVFSLSYSIFQTVQVLQPTVRTPSAQVDEQVDGREDEQMGGSWIYIYLL